MISETHLYSDGRTVIETVVCKSNHRWFLLQRMLSILGRISISKEVRLIVRYGGEVKRLSIGECVSGDALWKYLSHSSRKDVRVATMCNYLLNFKQ